MSFGLLSCTAACGCSAKREAVHRTDAGDWSGQVILAFFEKRKTQRWSLIGGKQEERLFWEQW